MRSTAPATDEVIVHTALRGFAALFVVLYRCALAHRDTDLGLAAGLIRNGYVFVDVFFVLSGFILMRQYRDAFAKDPGRSTANFMLRRFIRIYPAYLLWLIVSILVWFLAQSRAPYIEPGSSSTLTAVVAHVLMVQSILDITPNFNIPLWSIAVEFIAYLYLPLLVLAARERGTFALGLAIGAVFAGVWLFISVNGTIDVITGLGSVLRALLGFTLGGLACLLTQRHTETTRRLGRRIDLAAFVVMLVAFGTGMTLAGYIAAVVLVAATSLNSGLMTPLAALAVPRWIGLTSFSIYLCHVPILSVTLLVTAKLEAESGWPLFSNYWIFSALVVACCIAVASVSYRLVEVRLRAAISRRLAR